MIQNLVQNKRDKQIENPKTALTLDSDKQKQTLRKTWKRGTKSYHRHNVEYKAKLQNSKTLAKQNSNAARSTQIQEYNQTEIDAKCTK